MIPKITLIISLLVTAVGLSSLKAPSDTPVGGTVSSNTTWNVAGSPYIVIANVNVAEGVTLSIEPGVVVKFDPEFSLEVNGELIAQGSQDQPIRFTSNQTSPAPGDWGSIHFTSTAVVTTLDAEGNYVSGSLLQHCVVEYAGAGELWAVNAKSLMVDSCVIRDNLGGGISDPGTLTAQSRISGNIINNNHAIAPGSNGGGVLSTHCTLKDNKVTGNSASNHGGGIYAENCEITDNTTSDNTATARGGGIYAKFSQVSGNTAFQNNALQGGGIYLDQSIGNNNTSYANMANAGGGIFSNQSRVSESIAGGNMATDSGGGIHAFFSDVLTNTISSNTISGLGGHGAGAYAIGNQDFLNNTVIDNQAPTQSTAGGAEFSGTPSVHNNNLYANSPYDVSVVSSSDIDGAQNYWGTATSLEIADAIYDKDDNINRGPLNYQPYLESLNVGAPLPPPAGLSVALQGSFLRLSWTAVPGNPSDIRYKIYYDSDNPIPPFEGEGIAQGDSPINVGDETIELLSGFEFGQEYFFAVATYDSQGRESWYSRTLSIIYSGSPIYLPVIIK